MNRKGIAASVLAALLVLHSTPGVMAGQPNDNAIGADIRKIGLTPNYPSDLDCPPLTSLYSSRTDIDGSKRSVPHTGVDGGRLGDAILAPAAGVVIAVWEADWGWGREGALLIRHRKEDVGLREGPDFYYSEFDHLRLDDIQSIAVGTQVKRGERLATVFRPGGKVRYPPEVHWEVWAIVDDAATEWQNNKYGRPYWLNKTGHLVDPVYMLSLNAPPNADGSVDIPPFDPRRDYRDFRGFTYIFPCIERKRAGSGDGRR